MKYRTTGAWGSGEGRRLTSAEIDQNFYDVTQRLDAVEADIAAGSNPITNILSSGGSLYIYMASGTIFGPLAIPVSRWNDSGNWSAGTVYYVNDVVTIPGDGIYHVRINHVSDNNFDNTREIGGELVYTMLIAVPNPAPIINVTADIVILTAAHANAYVRCDNAVGTIAYIEAGTFDPPTEIHFRQVNTGQITFSYGDSGTFINLPDGCDLLTFGVGASVTLKCVGANEFDGIGSFALL
jgi:hypothetical protein